MAAAATALALERVLTDVRERWGQGSIVRLDSPSPGPGAGGGATLPAAQRRVARGAQPAWWPLALPDGGVIRPSVVEVLAPPGSGRLTLALAWLAAARPTLAAFVTPADTPGQPSHSQPSTPFGQSAPRSTRPAQPTLSGGIPFPPSVAQLGVDLERLILVRPPRPLDAAAVLLRSEAFDVVVCALPPGTRVSTTFAGKLATLASRSGTTLFLLTTPRHVRRTVPPRAKRFVVPFTVIHGAERAERAGRVESPEPRPPPPGLLAAFADYRLTIAASRPIWKHSQVAGLKLTLRTERARGSADDAAPGALTQETRELTLTYEEADRAPIVSWSPTSVREARADPAGSSVTPAAARLVADHPAPLPPLPERKVAAMKPSSSAGT